ncbi:MAG: hypothetical protein Q7K26_06395 [bacterium]|nr:hypothetical protein [bacterium]
MNGNRIYFKHIGLQIPDLFVEYVIDRENRKVKAKLNNHFDSALLLTFVQTIEETENICIADNRSDNTISPSQNTRYELEIELSGLVFETKIVRMGSWLSKPGSPNFTISMQLKK